MAPPMAPTGYMQPQWDPNQNGGGGGVGKGKSGKGKNRGVCFDMANLGYSTKGDSCWFSHDPDQVAAHKNNGSAPATGWKKLASGSAPEKLDIGHGMVVGFDEKEGKPGYAKLIVWETIGVTTNLCQTEINEAGISGLIFRPSMAPNCVREGFLELAGLLHPGNTLPDGSQLGSKRSKNLMLQILELVRKHKMTSKRRKVDVTPAEEVKNEIGELKTSVSDLVRGLKEAFDPEDGKVAPPLLVKAPAAPPPELTRLQTELTAQRALVSEQQGSMKLKSETFTLEMQERSRQQDVRREQLALQFQEMESQSEALAQRRTLEAQQARLQAQQEMQAQRYRLKLEQDETFALQQRLLVGRSRYESETEQARRAQTRTLAEESQRAQAEIQQPKIALMKQQEEAEKTRLSLRAEKSEMDTYLAHHKLGTEISSSESTDRVKHELEAQQQRALQQQHEARAMQAELGAKRNRMDMELQALGREHQTRREQLEADKQLVGNAKTELLQKEQALRDQAMKLTSSHEMEDSAFRSAQAELLRKQSELQAMESRLATQKSELLAESHSVAKLPPVDFMGPTSSKDRGSPMTPIQQRARKITRTDEGPDSSMLPSHVAPPSGALSTPVGLPVGIPPPMPFGADALPARKLILSPAVSGSAPGDQVSASTAIFGAFTPFPADGFVLSPDQVDGREKETNLFAVFDDLMKRYSRSSAACVDYPADDVCAGICRWLAPGSPPTGSLQEVSTKELWTVIGHFSPYGIEDVTVCRMEKVMESVRCSKSPATRVYKILELYGVALSPSSKPSFKHGIVALSLAVAKNLRLFGTPTDVVIPAGLSKGDNADSSGISPQRVISDTSLGLEDDILTGARTDGGFGTALSFGDDRLSTADGFPPATLLGHGAGASLDLDGPTESSSAGLDS